MTVRIRLRFGPAFPDRVQRSRKWASFAAALLSPAALMALVLGLWRLASDLQWTGRFVFSQGLLSHWQVWAAMAGVLQICASLLSRYGRGSGAASS